MRGLLMVAVFDEDRLQVLRSSLAELIQRVEDALQENVCLDYDVPANTQLPSGDASSDLVVVPVDTEPLSGDTTPDLVVEAGPDGNYVARAEAADLPRLQISSRYLRMLDDPALQPDARDFVERKTKEAGDIVDAIAERQELLERLGRAIIDAQKAFLEKGCESIKPEKLDEVARTWNVPSRVVRSVVQNKRVQTPHGVVDLSDFFED